MQPAPIALFVYNRSWHTQQTLEALQRNHSAAESDLVIFSDGPKNESARAGVEAVRQYIRTVTGFRSVSIVERAENWGLSRSIITGVTDMVNRYGKVIVLEDDLITSPYFLRYMNEALALYESDDNVCSISGYLFPVAASASLPETFFLKDAESWGWATWQRSWRLFEEDGGKLLREILQRNLKAAFDVENSYPYTQMLSRQAAGAINSWAIRWQASAFLHNLFTLHPNQSLVQNIGHDGSGTHCAENSIFNVHVKSTPVTLEKIAVEEHPIAKKAVVRYLRSINPPKWKRLLLKLNQYVRISK